MKKILTIVTLCFLAIGLVSAVQASDVPTDRPGMPSMDDGSMPPMGEEGMPPMGEEGMSPMDNDSMPPMGEEGKSPMDKESNLTEVRNMQNEMVQNKTGMGSENSSNMIQNKAREMGGFFGNMTNESSKAMLKELKLESCENCTFDLNESSMIYNMNGKVKGKFLGIFNTNIDVEAEVDATTGEVISSKKSWWSFLSTISD